MPRRHPVHQDDVPAGTAVDHVVAVQSKHHVIAGTTFDNVGAAERLVGCCTCLNVGVINIVVIRSNQKLGP